MTVGSEIVTGSCLPLPTSKVNFRIFFSSFPRYLCTEVFILNTQNNRRLIQNLILFEKESHIVEIKVYFFSDLFWKILNVFVVIVSCCIFGSVEGCNNSLTSQLTLRDKHYFLSHEYVMKCPLDLYLVRKTFLWIFFPLVIQPLFIH